tara:strand:+ start:272 stop:484 length:213 start_codon:yes stop_codon:yes gene_type:complete
LPLGVGALVDLPVHEVDAIIDDRGTGIPPADGGAPENLWASFGKFIEDASFSPYPISAWAKPLGPVIGKH